MNGPTDILALASDEGFEDIATGGGCSALSFKCDDGFELMMTEECGGECPDAFDEGALCGVYHPDGSPVADAEWVEHDQLAAWITKQKAAHT